MGAIIGSWRGSTSSCSGPTTSCARWPGSPSTPVWARSDERALARRGARDDRGRPRGADEWLAAFERAKDPWFWFSTGAGVTHQDRAWIDDLTIPFGVLRTYVEKLQRGENIERPLEAVQAEAARLTSEYRELLTDDDGLQFDDLVRLARTVYPFVENHNFYCERQH